MDRAIPAVLLVEDDADAASAIAELLEAHGFDVVTAQSGEQALEEMRRHGRPGVMLCDFMLPDMNGRELVDRVRSESALADTAIVMVTGMPPSATPPGIQLLRKPFQARDLVAIVERYCRRGYASAPTEIGREPWPSRTTSHATSTR